MKRVLRIALLVVLLGTIAGATAVAVNTYAQGEIGQPTMVPAEALTPAPTPPDSRRIAILSLLIASNEEGAVEEIGLENGRVLVGYAPNVIGLYGPWTVELVTRDGTSIRYGTLDPRATSVEDGEGDTPHTRFIETSTSYELVVPLSDPEGADLQVAEIRLFDQNGKPIFAATVSDEELVQIPTQRQ